MKLVPRWQTTTLQHAMQTRRVLLLCGVRQCGKTTLAKQIANKNAKYLTLDNLALREIALNDPHGFVEHNGNLLIIDEIQRAPDLLSAIKLVVDENTAPGQYLLTGSANLQALPGVHESLAGRIRKIRLRPLTQGELLNAEPLFLNNAFNQVFPSKINNHFNRKKMLDIAFRGGFPEIIKLDEKERHLWHNDFIAALLERDLKDIAHITRYHAMKELINIIAAWSSKLMDISAICSGLAVGRNTVETYINALETLYLIERVPSWTRTDYERVGKQSKLYMTDSGLMSSILHWHIDQIEFDPDRSGKLLETFIFNELAAQIDTEAGKYELFHYRDREQREIDFLIEREDHALLGIEIKAGSTISTTDFKHLSWFKDNIAKKRPFLGIVLYSGQQAGKMGENLWAVPYDALWS